MNKQELRLHHLNKRNALTAEDVSAYSASIQSKLRALSQFQNATHIAGYMPKDNEADLRPLFFNSNRNFAFPAIQNGHYVLAQATHPNQFKKGKFGILEPSLQHIVPAKDIDVWLIPGVAFSHTGQRIGFGKGIYDRLLSTSNGFKIGICFTSQIIDEDFESDEWDIRMDLILTE